jgi:hypothetical protein
MKKKWVLFLDNVLHHLICYKTSFGFHYQYSLEIFNTYIEPITKIIGDPWGDYHIEIVWSKPPKWYKNWMRSIEYYIAQKIYAYLLKNKEILKRNKKVLSD